MYYTYVLQSDSSRRYYIGSTSDIRRRLKEHNSGKTKSTKNRGPFRVVYVKIQTTKEEAYRHEMKIKSYKSGNAFKKLLQSNILPGRLKVGQETLDL